MLREADRHPLHQGDRVWLETNCYVDLWIELLHDFGFDPRAALGFTVMQAFEGDQFTFPKFSLDDIARLYGLQAQELAIYDTLERHVLEQTRRGHVVIVEVDAFYLPDTRATNYHQSHSKTTIGIKRVDTSARQLEYFHNAGYYTLGGDDYDGVFSLAPELAGNPNLLFPVRGIRQAQSACVGGYGARAGIGEHACDASLAASDQQSDHRMARGFRRARPCGAQSRHRLLSSVFVQRDASVRRELRDALEVCAVAARTRL